jgi:hypothetical protein
MSDDFKRHAVLQGYAGNDGGVLGGAIAVGSSLRIADEDFRELAAICKKRNARNVLQPVALKSEVLAGSLVWQAAALGHGSAPAM